MKIRPFQAIYPNTDYIASNDSFFGTVKEEYVSYKESGFFNKASQESVYIYRIQSPTRNHTGLVACADINEYLKGNIKKHENTLAATEQRQMYLMMNRKAIVKPVLLIYPKVKKLNELFEKHMEENDPYYTIHFEKENATHILWEVNDGNTIEKIQQLFEKKIPETYIADGHHRCAASALLYSRTKNKEKVNLEIINSIGEHIYNAELFLESGLNYQIINLNNHSGGIYFIKMNTQYGMVVKKFIIE